MDLCDLRVHLLYMIAASKSFYVHQLSLPVHDCILCSISAVTDTFEQGTGIMKIDLVQ